MLPAASAASRYGVLDGHQRKLRSDSFQIARVAGHHRLPGSARANDNMSIDDVRCRGSGQQEADLGCVRSIERNKIRAGLSNEPAEACLPGRVAHGLRQRRCRYRNPHAAFFRACEQYQHPPVVAVQSDQSTGVQGDATHAAFPVLDAFLRPLRTSCASAHARSFLVSGPPVCRSASFNIWSHPAAS